MCENNKMSKLRFRISDYHAVADAEIRLDGITVIAGPNASGKSTIARWLYYIVHAICDYDSIVINEGITSIFDSLLRLRSIANILSVDISKRIRNGVDDIINNYKSGESSFEKVKDDSLNVINLFIDYLRDKSADGLSLSDARRLSAYFHISEQADENKENWIDVVEKLLSSPIMMWHDNIQERLSDRSCSNLDDAIYSIIDTDFDNETPSFSLYEEDIPLLDTDFFRQPLTLKRAIYFDTQRIGMALDPSSSSPMREFLLNRNSSATPNARIVADMIKRIIDGSIDTSKNDDLSFRRNTLLFQMRDGSSIYLKAAATGVISFAYILRLIENGWLNEETLLIIDEPEAHLHPQWIVEYARILILINKLLGTKILVSSHSPDFVAAVKSISIANEISEVTNFYIAKEADFPEYIKDGNYYIPRYIFNNLGCQIGEIFDSFNIALDRIAEYGVEE